LPHAPTRAVHRADALVWLGAHAAEQGTSVITSLPDFSELRELTFEDWQGWFVRAAGTVIEWVRPGGVTIFLQTDVRRRGVWLDKSHLVLAAAESTGAELVWHKIVCRSEPGTITHGKAGYSHLLCFAREPRLPPVSATPDVLPEAGFKPAEKSMGVNACALSCRFASEAASARTILDPFCGQGTVLAVANALGLDAVGVDKSARACSAARRLELSAAVVSSLG